MRNVRSKTRSGKRSKSVLSDPVQGRLFGHQRTRTVQDSVHTSAFTYRLDGRVVAIDVETTGLNLYQGDRVFCFAYFTDKGEYGYFEKCKRSLRWLEKLFSDPTKIVVFHNGKFDTKALLLEGLDIFSAKATIHDTMIQNKVLNSTWQGGHDLHNLAIRYFNAEPEDKTDIADWCKERNTKRKIKERGYAVNFSHAPTSMVKRRVLWDVEHTLLLHHYLMPRIKSICPDLYETERKLLMVCVDMEHRGVQVDITKAKELKAEASEDMSSILNDINEIVGMPITVKRNRRGEEIEEEINEFKPGSNQHLEAAWNKMGIKLKYKTKPKRDKKTGLMKGGGNWCFDEYAMIRYVPDQLAPIMRESSEEGWSTAKFRSALIRTIKKYKLSRKYLVPPLILRYNQLSKMCSTYYSNIIEMAVDVHIRPDGTEVGVLHCLFNQSEAMTGRFSSSKPNLQNIPRILGPRQCFITRKSRNNWHLDYSQVEMRFFCHFAEDRDMAAAIDDDVHMYVAEKIYRKKRDTISKEQRKRAKSVNFGIIYGSGPAKQAETLTKKGLPTSKDEATVLVASYHREFPKVKRLTNQLKAELIREGYVTNPFGRRYSIDPKFGYKTLNYYCQGTSADLIKEAMVQLWEWLRDKGMKSKIIMTVHDEVVIEVPPCEEKTVIPIAVKLMQRLDQYFVPMKVEAEVAVKRWSKKLSADKYGLKLHLN